NPDEDPKKKKDYIDLRGYYFNSRMLDDEIAFMQDHITGYLGTLRHQHRLGGRFEYARKGFVAAAEYIWARDGRLDRVATSFDLGYKFKLGPDGDGYKYGVEETRIFGSVMTLVRFEAAKNSLRGLVLDSASGLPARYRTSPDDPTMWDREQLTFAVITELTDYADLVLEYSIRDEFTGGFTPAERNVDNNEFLMTLRFNF
ncbi:MAG: hypothetical protein ACYS8W_15805, partial [Planctomycetota bacterium]